VTTAAADMHSGMKGGSVQNANHALMQLLAGLRDNPSQVGQPHPHRTSSGTHHLGWWCTATPVVHSHNCGRATYATSGQYDCLADVSSP